MPAGVLVPDLVMAFTCTPLDRPCARIEAVRDELELRDRVAAVARLPEADGQLLVTCWPSRFIWNADVRGFRRTGTSETALSRLPGRQHRQVHPVPAVHRQFLHLSWIDVAAQRSTASCR